MAYIRKIELASGKFFKLGVLSPEVIENGAGVHYLEKENTFFPISGSNSLSTSFTLKSGVTFNLTELSPVNEYLRPLSLVGNITDADGNEIATFSTSSSGATRIRSTCIIDSVQIVLSDPVLNIGSTQLYCIGYAAVGIRYYYTTATGIYYYGYMCAPIGLSSTKDEAQEKLDSILNGNKYSNSSDPYDQDGTGQSEGGGGEGDFDDSSDEIDIPNLPNLSAVDTGFIGLFTPSLTQLKNLANYMWSDLFSTDSFKKLFADPMDCILGLSIVPVSVPHSTSGAVTVGNISTGIIMNIASSQYVSVDCGTLNINEYWGSFLDYAPHTKAQIYLPYIGVRQIDTDEIMGKAVRIVYHVDILTGACICFITSGGSVLYTFEGACASSIPITGNNFTEMINTIVSIAGAAVATAATGGAAAPAVAASTASTATKVTSQLALSTASNLSNMKPTIEHSGSVAGAGGLLAIQKPYLIAHRPNQCLPENQNTFSGYPSYITSTIGAQSGFTQIEYINMSGLNATEAEVEEIESKLKSGVII